MLKISDKIHHEAMEICSAELATREQTLAEIKIKIDIFKVNSP